MKKALRISLRIIAILLGIIILIFIGGSIYLNQHKKKVIAFIQTEVKKGLNGGELLISDIDISLFHTFPRIAFTVDSVRLRDSRWKEHHHDFVFVAKAYASLNFFKLITGKISVSKIQLDHPHIYLFTDTSGYTNTDMFKKSDNPKKAREPKTNPDLPSLEINEGSLIVDKKDKNKFFGFDIQRLFCEIHTLSDDPTLNIDADLNCKVQKMVFNPEKGGYLVGKSVIGKILIHFNPSSKILHFEKINLAVDEQPFVFTGKFFLAEVPTPFLISWETDNLPFRKAASFLANNIRLKLDSYDISESISHLTGSLDNSEPEYATPLIHLWLKVEKKSVINPVLTIDSSSFIATFNNEEIKGKGHEDSNTVMHFTPFNGIWNKMNLHCDSIIIRDLIHPRLRMQVASTFRLENINNLLDENTLAFNNGTGEINLNYNGSLESNYDSLRSVNGSFIIDTRGIVLVPRNLLFKDVNGVIRFINKDMIIDNFSMRAGSSDLTMNGAVKSLFFLINQRNNKLALEWNMKSNKLNLGDFTGYLTKKAKAAPVKKKKLFLTEMLSGITNLIETANMNVNLNAKQVTYKKFYADNLQASLELNDNTINLKKIRLQYGTGLILVNGNIRNEIASNPFTFQAQLQNVDVSKVFAAFNSFGMKSLTDKNIAGTLTADVNLRGEVTTKAAIIQDSTKGYIKFNLHNGQLIDFDAVKKISQTIFKDRNFSDIKFADLHDLMEVNGNNITINRMEINSNVLHMFVEGIYNLKTGPLLSIQVPLSNLKAEKSDELKNHGIDSKTGISARLRAQNGPDGKLKISWDPFNKTGKAIKKGSKKKGN